MNRKTKNSFALNLLWTVHLLFAILFLLSVMAGYIPPSKIPFFSLFGLIFPILLFTNLLFLLLWVVLCKKRVLLSLVVLLLGTPVILRYFGFRQTPSGISSPNRLKVISYNVQGFTHSNKAALKPAAKQDIFGFLLKQNPDIVCLQEYHSKDKRLFQALDNKRDPHNGTRYFQSYFGPEHKNLTGLIIFSKFHSAENGYLKFQQKRTFAVYTDLVIGTDTVRVINVHLASIRLSPVDLEMIRNGGIDQNDKISNSKRIYQKLVTAYKLHEMQMNAILELVKNTGGKIIICGDFNDTPGSYTYKKVSEFFTDVFLSRGFGMSPTYAGPIPFLRIDYILLKGNGLIPAGYQRFKVRYSDHYPIAAELILKPTQD